MCPPGPSPPSASELDAQIERAWTRVKAARESDDELAAELAESELDALLDDRARRAGSGLLRAARRRRGEDAGDRSPEGRAG